MVTRMTLIALFGLLTLLSLGVVFGEPLGRLRRGRRIPT